MYPLVAKWVSIAFAMSLGQWVLAQSSPWEALAQVAFEEVYVSRYESWLLKPQYQPEAKNLCQAKITLSGYLIPMDVQKGIYALSKYPFASCFFCGGAGPETVIQLQLSPNTNHKVDTFVEISGVLNCSQEAGLDLPYSIPKPTLRLP